MINAPWMKTLMRSAAPKAQPDPGLEFAPSENRAPILLLACCQRSGSTLVQRLINSHSDILIWGEHGGYLNHLYDGYESLKKWKELHDHSAAEFVSLSADQFMPNSLPDRPHLDEAFRQHILELFPVPAEISDRGMWGFKEVRYSLWTAKFIEGLFPEAKVIHVVRNIDDCLTSMRSLERVGMWQTEWTDEAIVNWAKINQSFVDFSKLLRNYLCVRYEDLISAGQARVAGKIETFLGIGSGSLDLKVLKRHVDLVEKKVRRVPTSDEDRAFLAQPEIMKLKHHFGYE